MTHRIAMETPIGVLTIESNEKAVTLITLPREAGEHSQAANGQSPAPKSEDGPVPEPLALAVAQLEEYFAGRRQQFDLPLELDGTDFQRRVADPGRDPVRRDGELRRIGHDGRPSERLQGSRAGQRGEPDTYRVALPPGFGQWRRDRRLWRRPADETPAAGDGGRADLIARLLPSPWAACFGAELGSRRAFCSIRVENTPKVLIYTERGTNTMTNNTDRGEVTTCSGRKPPIAGSGSPRRK